MRNAICSLLCILILPLAVSGCSNSEPVENDRFDELPAAGSGADPNECNAYCEGRNLACDVNISSELRLYPFAGSLQACFNHCLKQQQSSCSSSWADVTAYGKIMNNCDDESPWVIALAEYYLCLSRDDSYR